uniref:Uncharacterized protein n=1 Tax=Triticum urartu TaxID=4572 RepID=A0A8R7NZA9_TRIUA
MVSSSSTGDGASAAAALQAVSRSRVAARWAGSREQSSRRNHLDRAGMEQRQGSSGGDSLAARAASGQTSSSSRGRRAAVGAHELHRRQGRSSCTGARAGEKEQQGLAREIEEEAR